MVIDGFAYGAGGGVGWVGGVDVAGDFPRFNAISTFRLCVGQFLALFSTRLDIFHWSL